MKLADAPNDKHMKFFQVAYMAALLSEGTGRNYFRLGSVLVYKKAIYAIRPNSFKTHPKLLRFTKYPVLHAESACILCRGLYNCEGMTLYTIRLLSNNHIALAKPCKVCYDLMEYVGIKEAYYTTENGYDKVII